MKQRFQHFYDALERLVTNTPIRENVGEKISKASVAREAGRTPSSIKKSRPEFEELIAAIEAAAAEQSSISVRSSPTERLKRERLKKKDYRKKFRLALNRELVLTERLAVLESRLQKFENVTPLFDS